MRFSDEVLACVPCFSVYKPQIVFPCGIYRTIRLVLNISDLECTQRCHYWGPLFVFYRQLEEQSDEAGWNCLIERVHLYQQKDRQLILILKFPGVLKSDPSPEKFLFLGATFCIRDAKQKSSVSTQVTSCGFYLLLGTQRSNGAPKLHPTIRTWAWCRFQNPQ